MISIHSLAQIKAVSQVIKIKRNDFFVREDEVCLYMGLVKSGTLYSYFTDADANILVNELYREDAVITSYRSFLSGCPSPANLKAYSDVEIYAITKENYLELMLIPAWTIIFKEIADELFMNKCFKETSLIKLKAKERYLALLNERTHLEQDFPQHLIASYLKIRPETLSRLKSLDLHQGKK